MNKYRIESILDYSTLALLLILYLNLASVCAFTISCSAFIPTLSYVATFRTHDLIVVFVLTLYSWLFVPLFISWHIKTFQAISFEDTYFMLALELCIFILTITVGLIDESNGIDFNPMNVLHHFLSFNLCVVGLLWVYYALKMLELTNLTEEEKKNWNTCWNIFKIGFLLVILTIFQWYFAYTTYSNFFINLFVESLCEWTLITVSIRFPYYFSKIIGCSLYYSISQKSKI